MKVKTYKSRSLQEGLETIKQDLGSEALIVSTKNVSGFLKRSSWEITAALEDSPPQRGGVAEGRGGRSMTTPSAPSLEAAPYRACASPAQPPLLSKEGNSTAATAAAPAPIRKDPRMDTLIDEVSELKKSLRSLSKAIPAKADNGGLFSELVTKGIDHDLADHLITTASRGNPAPSELRERVRRLLGDQIVIAPPAEFQARTRIVSIFVGPTGVGKTTTIAKIAGHAAIRMKKKVALISTDMFRVAGQEQLNRFGELLGVPAFGCADVATLKDLIQSLDDKDLVLIDTPGSSPSDLARLSKLENVTKSAEAKVHLVISATTRSEDISKIVTRFQRFSPNSVIFTKIDETDAKGPLAGDLLRNELAVSYLTNGQRVPEDLLIPGADEMARYVLPLEPAI